MITYEYQCTECGHEWEEEQMIKDPVTTVCPVCGKESAQRLCSGGTKPIMVLAGQELVSKVKADAVKMRQDMRKDEKKMANFVGEEKYHQNKLNGW